jgi:hypothetical protein
MTAFDRGLSAAGVIATGLLSLYGFWQAATEVYTRTKSYWLTATIGALVAAVLVVPFLFHFFRPPVLRSFGLGRFPTRHIRLRFERTTEVDATFRATMTERTQLVYLDAPTEDDLVDLNSIDPQLSIEGLPYISDDALEVRRQHLGPHRLAYYWRPRIAIQPFVPYSHHHSYVAPVSYDAPASYTELHVDVETGEFVNVVSYPIPIERVATFARPARWALADDLTFMQFAIKSMDQSLGSVLFSADRRQFTWRLVNPPVGRHIVCVFFRDGGLEDWKRKIAAERRWPRVRRLARNTLRSLRSPT